MNKFLSALFVLCFSLAGRASDLSKTMSPENYLNRDKPVINAALVYYGRYWKEGDLKRLKPILEKRFSLATEGALTLNVVYTETMDYRHKIENFPDYANNDITNPARLQRLWYYDNQNGKVLKEAWDEFKGTKLGKKHFPKLDALLIVSGAQFNALGFASGRVAITEQPMEIAWNLPGGGRTKIVSDYAIADELVHELGHVMFLGHTSTHCMKRDLTFEERRACCESSPSKNDVMSYCRKRKNVDERFFHKFESCNLEMIENKIRPAMMSGGKRKISNRSRCK